MCPKVSVIIPCYNYGNFLSDAVNSLIRQSFSDWEAILIDDASTDNTKQLIKSFKDSRIVRVFHRKNVRNIATYNEGIKLCKGEYVAILSADDTYKPDFLRQTVQILEANQGAAMAYTGWEILNARGKFVRNIKMPYQIDGVHNEFTHLLIKNHIAQCSALVRRSVYIEVGLYRQFPNAGDWDIWLRISRKHPIAFVAQSLYQYRRHGSNMSLSTQSVIATEKENHLILEGIFSDPSLPSNVRDLIPTALGMTQWSSARLRFMQRDWSGALKALANVMRMDARIFLPPRRWGSLLLAIIKGLTGKNWLGV